MSKGNKSFGRVASACVALALGASALSLAASPVAAQPMAARPSETLNLSAGTGTMVRLSAPMSDLFISNDAVADVQVRSQNQLYIFGKSRGETTMYATDKSGRVVYAANIRVGNNISSVDEMLRMAMPDSQLQATPMNNLMLLIDSKPGGFLFGIGQGDPGNLGGGSTGGGRSFNIADLGTTLAFGGKFLGLDLLGTLDLLTTDGLSTTLAEPNLTALSGETASFLAGGEFPIPVSQGLGELGRCASPGRVRHSGPDHPPGRNHRRAGIGPELHACGLAQGVEQQRDLEGTVSGRPADPWNAVPFAQLPAGRNRAGDHRHTVSGASD
jgi:pilus assembly protein CpaC